ncbi:hypothetical protein MMIC_P0738 [Mariprofundus micogutta]|uniref:Uncharacterized protein n=1 Tax=Mariprofundus micogutta TaxID=1921010 RepID=A0A1L8CLH4_9PROT|nr:hypothetical protein [Mariprofundus micogutta]GAV19780.1 hypothetical protein MMIC_P0738 [Mariprofundus micogutta]
MARPAIFPAITAVMVSLLVIGCAGDGLKNDRMLRGFNALQHKNVAWDDARAQKSVKKLAAMGSNAVVFIPFLEQKSASSLEISKSAAVTDAQLRAAVRHAKKYGLKVTIKPQILIPGSWAGAIKHKDEHSWQAWFDSYSKRIIEHARFAAELRVDSFVIGTELSQAARHVPWPRLIRQLRDILPKPIILTYAAHNIDGLKAFPYWQDLDAVALTLYPSLGDSGSKEEMKLHIDQTVEELRLAVAEINLPLWVLEIGMPSAAGASARPWEWHNLKSAKVDLSLQKNALDLWLRSLDQAWVNGVFVWAWYSDIGAGGAQDADYTPQNKPAEKMIRRYWKS